MTSYTIEEIWKKEQEPGTCTICGKKGQVITNIADPWVKDSNKDICEFCYEFRMYSK